MNKVTGSEQTPHQGQWTGKDQPGVNCRAGKVTRSPRADLGRRPSGWPPVTTALSSAGSRGQVNFTP